MDPVEVESSTSESNVSDELASIQKSYDEQAQVLESATGEADRAEALCSMANLAYEMSNETVEEERLQWLKIAHDHALAAHTLRPNSLEYMRILCSTTGRLAEESSLREKINYGFEFKSYLDKAVSLDDESDPEATFEIRHMRGRFIYSVRSLSFIERTLARAIGCLPSVSLEEAIADLEKADSLFPGTPENELYLGKCHLADGDKFKAKEWLNKAAAGDISSVMEGEHVKEARELLRTTNWGI